MPAGELKQEIAIVLFQKNMLTVGQASQLADISQLHSQHLLASRDIELDRDGWTGIGT